MQSKLAAVVLSSVLALGLSGVAFADATNATIAPSGVEPAKTMTEDAAKMMPSEAPVVTAPTDAGAMKTMAAPQPAAAPMKKPAMKKPAPKKPAMKKPAPKKPAMKKPAPKKPAMKKPAPKKPAPKKPMAKPMAAPAK